MRGNSAIIKCLIPSFVADFVQVVAWIDDDGKEFSGTGDFIEGRKKLTVKIQLLFPILFIFNCFSWENNLFHQIFVFFGHLNFLIFIKFPKKSHQPSLQR